MWFEIEIHENSKLENIGYHVNTHIVLVNSVNDRHEDKEHK
jgi:hypothetical protein